MKLATYKDGSRDGQLVVVSRDLSSAHFASGIATRLQQVLDDWNFLSPQLEDLAVTLNQGKARHAFAFEPRLCMAPLPRAYQWASACAGRWADGSAYPSHGARLRQARGEPAPDSVGGADNEPPMARGGSDRLLGPHDDAWFNSADQHIDFSAELAVVTGDVAQGAGADQALESIRLVMLANDWRLRQPMAGDRAWPDALLQGRPATAFSPVAVTPDELGEAWHGGCLHLTLQIGCNGRRFGLIDAGAGMQFHFGQLIAHLAGTRGLGAGSIVGSGTVSGTDDARGHACIAERRAQEILAGGAPKTAYLAFGDRVTIEMKGRDGMSIFGAIDQRTTGPGWPPGEEAGTDPAAQALETALAEQAVAAAAADPAAAQG
jgi:fumarylacetoacetate (FAA) hydrolase